MSTTTRFRVVVTALAATLALCAWLDFQTWRGEIRRLERILATTGLAQRHPEVLAEIRREPEAEMARLRVARALFASELDQEELLTRSEKERQLGIDRLELAAELAAETLGRRPASWRGALVLGGANYLKLSRRRDPRMGLQPELWEAPLRTAHRLAPGHPEPPRLLAAAYIGNWSRLSAAKREEAENLLRTAFENPATMDLLIEDWLRVAPSLQRAMALLPDRPPVWDKLGGIYLARGDLERYRETRQRRYASLHPYLEQRLEEAATRLRLGETDKARRLLASVVAAAPPDSSFLVLLRATLELVPTGSVQTGSTQHFTRWLAWALELCLLHDCPLPPSEIARLAELSGDLAFHQSAMSSLAADNLALAELYERRAADFGGRAWTPYLIFKARRLARKGRLEAARSSLDRVDPTDRSSALYWSVKKLLSDLASDASEHERALTELAALRRRVWPSEAWTVSRRRARLEILPDAPAPGLLVEIDRVPAAGAVVEARVDGATVGFFSLTPGDRLALDLPLDPAIHSLELVTLVGRGFGPGRVRLGTPATGA